MNWFCCLSCHDIFEGDPETLYCAACEKGLEKPLLEFTTAFEFNGDLKDALEKLELRFGVQYSIDHERNFTIRSPPND